MMTKRIVAVAAVLAMLAGAAVATSARRDSRERARRDDLVQSAESARTQAQDALRVQLSSVEAKALAAASVPVLRAQIGIVDQATLRDGFRSEPWWRPVRDEFPVYGLSTSGNALDLVEGARPSELDAAALLAEARKKRGASQVIGTREGPMLAAAALIDHPSLQPVLLVARPFDADLAEELATRARGAVLLSDGKRALIAAGQPAQRAHLLTAVGAEAEAAHVGDGWAAAPAQLGKGTWLWVHGAPGRGDEGLPMDLIAIWTLAAVGSGLALAFGLRGRAAAPEEPAEAALLEAEAATRPALLAPARTGRSDPRAKGASAGAGPGRRAPATTGATGPGRAGRTNPTGTTGPGGGQPARAHPPARIGPGSQFGRYYLLDRLGEGGMAEVYSALAFGAENFRRAFVVKLLRTDAVRTEPLVSMFIDEARLGSSLIHSNIIPVFDFGKVGDEYFIAQEYILGRDLRRLTARAMERDAHPIASKLAVFVARQVLHALEYAHTRAGDEGRPLGIVHRDVSPNNVLISARGEVKLFDFGIAKADEGRLTQTQTGVVKGNVRFMSPEQARGEPVDARADIASLALVLYFLLTGEPLYEGETSYTILVQAAQGVTAEVEPRLARVGKPMADVLRKALAGDRERRFASAAEFEMALTPFPTGSSLELAREMTRLFGEELREEERRFAGVKPAAEPQEGFDPPVDDPPDETQPR